ncbi:hypothetical protein WSM22_36820 [Cytophagales bacterium WSM2-2]|nr:hypothetical protein WSM22_36820 [Cytophagales bacterium WSM2-2]
MRVYVGLLLLLASLLPQRVWSQLSEVPYFDLISEKDGLPFPVAYNIIEDRFGFIWIAGNQGIARYDGYSFVAIQNKPEAPHVLPANYVTSIAVDKDGMIWAGHTDGYFSCINPLTLQVKSGKIASINAPIQTIFCDNQGVLWCFVNGEGLHRYNKSKSTFTFVKHLTNLPQHGIFPPLAYSSVSNAREDNNHHFWLSTHNGLYKFNPLDSSLVHLSSLSADPDKPGTMMDVLPDGENVWCSIHSKGLARYDIIKNDFEMYAVSDAKEAVMLSTLFHKNSNEVGLGSYTNGVGVLDKRTKKITFFSGIDGDPKYGVYKSFVDRRGIIWLLTEKGMLKWNIERNHFIFNSLKTTGGSSRFSVDYILKDQRTGRTIYSTFQGDGIHIFDSLNRETILNPGGNLNAVQVVQGKSGKIFVLTSSRLFELTADNRLVQETKINSLVPPESRPYFYRMLESDNGDLWVTSLLNGVFHFNSTEGWERLTKKSSTILSDRCGPILEDAGHTIWFSHSGNGLSMYSPITGKWRYFQSEESPKSLISNMISDMTLTPAGDVFISTMKGISKFNRRDSTFVNQNVASGMPTEAIRYIKSDDSGVLWAPTDRSLLRIEPSGGGWNYQEYNFRDGLAGHGFFITKGDGDKMYLGTDGGFYSFKPSEIKEVDPSPAPLLITSVINLNATKAEHPLTDKFMVDYRNNSISIEFAALNFSTANRNRYRYRMFGLDKDWTETSGHSVNYSGIPSGSYTFQVELIGSPPGLGRESMGVVVSTPFWKENWFKMLITVIGVGVIYSLYRFRLKQIRAEEQLKREYNEKLADVEMKALKAQMNPHFIFNSLNSINRYIVKSESEKASLYLTKFSKLIRLILDSSNHKTISLENEINALQLYIELEALRFNDQFTYSIHADEEVDPILIGVPPMIIQPFVENAIWHGLLHKEESHGNLDVHFESLGTGIQCIITDNGIGRKKAAELKSKSANREKSFGLKITNDRLNMLNGESEFSNVDIIDLEDSEGRAVGTKVVVKIKSVELEPEF